MDWIPILVSLVGSVLGGYLGVKIAVAVLQSQMATIKEEVKSLREAKHAHAGMLTEHEMRITTLEKWRDSK